MHAERVVLIGYWSKSSNFTIEIRYEGGGHHNVSMNFTDIFGGIFLTPGSAAPW